uniref:4Fe-4S ferredoxin-type domain-containing protein n=1 Tax=Thermodesulfobacterium geofontis TaxID=1295609 RepID=A0A7V4JRE8_9BACT
MFISLWVDRKACTGCGYCIEACPEVFCWGAEKKQ